ITHNLHTHGTTTYLELGPDNTLTTLTHHNLPHHTPNTHPLLHPDHNDTTQLLTTLAHAHTTRAIDWATHYTRHTPRPQRVDLPTYPFQRQRFWLTASPGTGDAGAMGLEPAGHPLLGAAVTLAEDDGFLLTGRISLPTHPWLADHTIAGTALLPGTAFLELALQAAHHTHTPHIEELTLHTPLTLPETSTVTLQITVRPPDNAGRRTLTISSRTDNPDTDHTWQHHATGTLAPQTAAPHPGIADHAQGIWPPPGAKPIGLDGLYNRMAELGFTYGPVFQGLRAAWRHGADILAEVCLPDAVTEDAPRFALHPALLDVAVQTVSLVAPASSVEASRPEAGILPFTWNGVSLYTTGASVLRTRISPTASADEHQVISLQVADDIGRPVASVESLVLRPVSMDDLAAVSRTSTERADLFEVRWEPARQPSADPSLPAGRWAVFGLTGVFPDIELESGNGAVYSDISALVRALDAGSPVPDVLLLDCPPPSQDTPTTETIHTTTQQTLEFLQQWLAEERLATTRLVITTHGAMACTPGEDVNLPSAAVWGLTRSAQTEEPGRILIIDLDNNHQALWNLLPPLLHLNEPQAAVRANHVLVPRLTRAAGSHDGAWSQGELDQGWRLECAPTGTLEGLGPVASEAATVPLSPTQVRVGMRAAGVNFRDVLMALGVVEGRAGAGLGSEGAGIVLEVGTEVSHWKAGDRVMGVFEGAFAPVAITDQDLLAHIPQGWSFAQAASVPIVFATAYYGLVELADLRAGESLLVHAAAGGVGMAAVQLAHHLGAVVFATASPSKWEVLRSNGISPERIASSRTLDFEGQFADLTGGRGVDVVLDCLAGEFVDASLRLTSRDGGRFLEMGKSDIRDAQQVHRDHPGLAYQAFDLLSASPEQIKGILTKVLRLFDDGVIQPLPVTCWDIRDTVDAFRHMQQGRHIGKNVLMLPVAFDPEGTVLITGGTGVLGRELARHLATH
ncbi:polyketide synthase dehydratase domain-containing protein, partial [Streptomyces sp. NPDC046215]